MNATVSLRSTCLALLAGLALALPAAANMTELLQWSEKLDQIDKQDFAAAIDKANACTRARDFDCTEAQLAKAVKLANGSREREMLSTARQNVVAEKQKIAEEERLRAEEERRVAQAEERLRLAQAEADRAARRAQEDSGPSTASQLLQLGGMIARNYQASRAASAADNAVRTQAWNKMQSDVAAGLAQQQQQFAQEKARIEAAHQTPAQRQATDGRSAPAGQRAAQQDPRSVQKGSDREERAAADRTGAQRSSSDQRASVVAGVQGPSTYGGSAMRPPAMPQNPPRDLPPLHVYMREATLTSRYPSDTEDAARRMLEEQIKNFGQDMRWLDSREKARLVRHGMVTCKSQIVGYGRGGSERHWHYCSTFINVEYTTLSTGNEPRGPSPGVSR